MWKAQNSTHAAFEAQKGKCQRPNGVRSFRIWAERALLAFGLLLLAIYGVIRLESILGSRAALKRFAALDSPSVTVSQNAAATLPDISSSSHLDLPEADFSSWDERRVEAYEDSLIEKPGDPIAVLQIAKIHLGVPVFDGTDDLTLNRGVGRIAGTARPGEQGNIGIAGHRDGFFRGLKDVHVGDALELKTLNGTNTYVVDQIRIVRPDNVDVLRPRSVPSLTLVTCYPFYFIGSAPQRYIVTASLTRGTKSEPVDSTPDSLSQISSPKKEKQ